MPEQVKPQGVSRRKLLAGLGVTTAATLGSPVVSGALPGSEIKSWDTTTDVLIAGSGAAGICAALEASKAGAETLVIESQAKFGGSSAQSAGIVYAGGGTALQRALNIEDSPEEMFNFIVAGGGKHAQVEKIRLYCEQSVAHFDWLFDQGVPYLDSLAKTLGTPQGNESLFYSGNEFAWPTRGEARPAPRGHVPSVPGTRGGSVLMEALQSRADEQAVRMHAGVVAERLVVEGDGRVVGMQVKVGDTRTNIRARRGVVLACGGFIGNRPMVEQYAPKLLDCSVPPGSAGDLGAGINMGIAVGAAALRMHEGFAVPPIPLAKNVIPGILVDVSGRRFISEESYPGVLGHDIVCCQGGRAWLITDQRSTFQPKQSHFNAVARANTIGDLADQLKFPRGSLQQTVAYYNRSAQNKIDPLFHKSESYLRPLQGPPYVAWDISVEGASFPAYTFGGLHTRPTGEVVNSFGEEIPGLFAAGRNTAGLPAAPYIASGLSLGDCTFFGRLAGISAAKG